MRDRGAFKLEQSWPQIAWGFSAAVIVIACVLGFGVLSRYQQNDPSLDLWDAICRGLGIATDSRPADSPRPLLQVSTNVVWSGQTIERIQSGDVKRGAFVATNCTACHGSPRASKVQLVPMIDGMDADAVFKQLEDFRSGKRPSGVMGAIAKALKPQDLVDVSAYYASKRGASTPEAEGMHSGFHDADVARRLVFAGDPKRGIAPCASCHGPAGYKRGAPALVGQLPAYIERQLTAFAQRTRRNDVYGSMRSIARVLTPEERGALAEFYNVQVRRSAAR